MKFDKDHINRLDRKTIKTFQRIIVAYPYEYFRISFYCSRMFGSDSLTLNMI